ncbi:MAG: 4-hydroxythreonine-4-phosphate dehydrogenase, partial [Mesorhizobium sp.]
EPGGIGTEITLKAWLRLRQTGCAFFVLHDPDHVAEAASVLSLDVPVGPILTADDAVRIFRDALPVMPVRLAAPVRMGSPDTRNASAVVEAIRTAVRLAQSGEVAALVTNPIQKS